MKRHRHRWEEYCDCRDFAAEVERNCCCINDSDEQSECLRRPIYLCACGARKR